MFYIEKPDVKVQRCKKGCHATVAHSTCFRILSYPKFLCIFFYVTEKVDVRQWNFVLVHSVRKVHVHLAHMGLACA